MRTWETVLCILALTLTPLASAQEEDPSLNESDMDTAPPESDESYLDEAEQESAEEPTLGEGDMDTTAPEYDESYLTEAEREIADASTDADDDASAQGTPGAPVVALLVAVGILALAVRRR